jgi:putative oxidoreductase
MNKSKKIVSSILAIISAVIMLQTLYFKFSAAPESVYIFTQLHLEPYGRIGVGILELISSVLLIIPISRIYGAIIGFGIMFGAIFSHITQLGIVVMNDGGYLFILCLIVFVCCLVCLFLEKDKIIKIISKLFSK